MAKVIVDDSLCTGCGLCANSCPEVFEMGDDGLAHVINAAGECDAKQAADDCPVGAITVK